MNDERLNSLPPEPRMTRSSSLRRANSLKRFNNRNHGSVTSPNANGCAAVMASPGKVDKSYCLVRVLDGKKANRF